MQGWICPKCGMVNAPHIPHCDCIPGPIFATMPPYHAQPNPLVTHPLGRPIPTTYVGDIIPDPYRVTCQWQR